MTRFDIENEDQILENDKIEADSIDDQDENELKENIYPKQCAANQKHGHGDPSPSNGKFVLQKPGLSSLSGDASYRAPDPLVRGVESGSDTVALADLESRWNAINSAFQRL